MNILMFMFHSVPLDFLNRCTLKYFEQKKMKTLYFVSLGFSLHLPNITYLFKENESILKFEFSKYFFYFLSIFYKILKK